MSERRLFIVNPMSARVAKKGSVLKPIAQASGEKLLILETFDTLGESIVEATKDGTSHVIIEGGDGTTQGVLSAFLQQAAHFKTFPKFTLVPGGMTNQVSRNIGLKSSRATAVAKALSTPLREIEVPMLEVHSTDMSPQAGFLFSTGAIPQLTEYTTQELHRRGIGGSMAVIGGVLKGVFGKSDTLMQPSQIKMYRGAQWDGDHLGTILTTLPGLLLGLDPFYGAGEGRLRLTYVAGQYRGLARNIIGLWMGRKQKDRSADGIFSHRADDIGFEYDQPIVLDGEFLSFPSGKFTVRAGRPVTFLR